MCEADHRMTMQDANRGDMISDDKPNVLSQDKIWIFRQNQVLLLNDLQMLFHQIIRNIYKMCFFFKSNFNGMQAK